MVLRTRYVSAYPLASITVVSFLLAAFAFAANPVPQVVGPPIPQAVVPGSGEFMLTVYGANFVSGAVVDWNRSPRSTTFISARELKARILASDVATATAGYITVTNPPPGGGVSSSSYGLVEVHTPTATIVANKPNVYLKGGGAQFIIPTDFNNDGILDFAASWGSEIQVLLGNGNGTLRFGSFATHSYYSSSAIAYGDFDNDGNEDLVFGADPKGPPTQLKVSLGNGDGTFRQGSRFWRFNVLYLLAIVVGDFNRDGNLDLVTNPSKQEVEVAVFLGNGDGTFKHLVDYSVGDYYVISADFNGDGILDLALLWDHAIYVMLGNGDGTFHKPRTVIRSSKQIGACSPGFAITDINADGKSDLVYCERDQNNGKLWVALGNGDGTFKKPVSYAIPCGIFGFSFGVGDFNSDGKTDLLVNYLVSDTQSETDLLLGDGDGTFQPKKVVKLGCYNAEDGIVPADFNSDGLLDFIFQEPGDVSVFVQK
jgi:hypothetical protein